MLSHEAQAKSSKIVSISLKEEKICYKIVQKPIARDSVGKLEFT